VSAVYQDEKAPVEERVSDLLGRMTVEEKVGQMMQLPANRPGMIDLLESQHIGSYLHCTGDLIGELQGRAEKTRLGIPLIFGIDAIHGHCFDSLGTVFPTQLAMACAWDRSMLRAVGRATATEVRATGIHWTFSPVLCVGRDPRWGRIDETFGEDPWLIGELAAELVAGYQGAGPGDPFDPVGDFAVDDRILACAKHFAAYGEATGGRDAYESEVSRRKLLAFFLPPFEKAVRRAGCATLMTAYQAIDGTPCTADPWLLRTVPKELWRSDGFIVTDWNNVGSLHERQSVAADSKEAAYLAILAGNDMIMSTPSFYDDALELVGEGKIDIGLIDDSVSRILRAKFRLGLFDALRHVDARRRSSVVGSREHADAALAAARETVVLLKNDPVAARRRSGIRFGLGGGDAADSTDTTRVLPVGDGIRSILVTGPGADDPVAQLGDWSFGSMQAGADDDSFHRKQTTTVRDAMETRCAAAEVSFVFEPGVESIGIVAGDTPGDPRDPSSAMLSRRDEELIRGAVRAAGNVDLVVAVVGDTLRQHGEYHDRGVLALSCAQQRLLEELATVGKPIVVVYLASKPLAIGVVKRVADAVICAFNPGQAGGAAIAEVLFGDINPSGKLPISFPVHEGQLPVYYNRYGGWHSIADGDSGGERYFDLPAEPLFAFGEGLSYTTFTYTDLQVETPILTIPAKADNLVRPDGDAIPAGPPLRVTVTVTNTGDREGTEVVQLYIRDCVSTVTRPLKELRGFERVTLAAGESAAVALAVSFDDLALVDRDLVRRVEPGRFEVMVGSSSRDEDLLRAEFEVQ